MSGVLEVLRSSPPSINPGKCHWVFPGVFTGVDKTFGLLLLLVISRSLNCQFGNYFVLLCDDMKARGLVVTFTLTRTRFNS